MGSDKNTRNKPLDISRGEGKSPDQIQALMPRQERSQNRRRARGAFSGRFHPGIALLLMALLIGSLWGLPADAASPSDICRECHGTFAENHGSINHNATLANTPTTNVTGWIYACDLCHNNDLTTIHGNHCDTCHPAAYGSLGTWNGGCQQGACHPTYHDDASTVHVLFMDWDSGTECDLCHVDVSATDDPWALRDPTCPSCHATTYGAADGTTPVTTSDAVATYGGPARIAFSILDDGKAGIGTTFYSLDEGTVTSGSTVLVSAPGSHQLEFWSVDQSGNVESVHNRVYFSIVEDNTPPTTASNARSAYSQSAVITLTSTDESALGVKNTYYSLNGGPTQTGTVVNIPPTGESGTIAYTLLFWSEDWAGNIEAPNSESFTIVSGTGTIRLVWGNSDTDPADRPVVDEDMASWSIRVGSSQGKVAASGSDTGDGWTGVNDVIVPVSLTPYWVIIYWDDYDEGGQTIHQDVNLTTPGQVLRLSY